MRRSRLHLICDVVQQYYKNHKFYNNFGVGPMLNNGEEGHLLEECNVCKFNEKRVLDYKTPLLLHFKDKNSNNYSLDNVQLLCYNHYFLQVGDIFNKQDIKQLETQTEQYKTTEKVEWEVDDYHLQRLKELGLDDADEDEVNKYISRI